MITSIDQLNAEETYSYADYLKWQVQERLEIIRGKIFNMSPAPNMKHQRVSMMLAGKIYQVIEHQTCQVFSAPFDVRLPRKNKLTNKEILTVVQPDICVICDPAKLDQKGCIGAPDWIIEILSPGNSRKEMKEKYSVYEEAGVKEYWLVEPHLDIILVYLLDEKGKFRGLQPFTTDDVLQAHTLPDVHINLEKLFA